MEHPIEQKVIRKYKISLLTDKNILSETEIQITGGTAEEAMINATIISRKIARVMRCKDIGTIKIEPL